MICISPAPVSNRSKLLRGLDERRISPLWVENLNTIEPIIPRERSTIESKLSNEFNCVSVFITSETRTKFYQVFCKGTLWPIFHMITDVYGNDSKMKCFAREAWHAFVASDTV